MDGNFFVFVSQILIKLHLVCHQLFRWSWTNVIYISTANIGTRIWMEFFLFFFKSKYSCTFLVIKWLAGLELMWFTYLLPMPAVVYVWNFFFLFVKSGYSYTLLVINWSIGLEPMWFIFPVSVPEVVYGWKFIYFYFSSLAIVAPCLSPIVQLVLNWCDLHIGCQYQQWSMDGKFFVFYFSSLIKATTCFHHLISLSWADVIYISTTHTSSDVWI